MKLALLFGPYSVGARPFNCFYNNFWIAERGATGSDLGFIVTALKLAKLGHDVSTFTIHVPGTKPESWEGVKFYNYEDRIIINNTFDAMISWNEPDVFRGLPANKVRVCQQMLNDFPYCQVGFDDFVDVWTSPSDMHRQWMIKQTPIPEKWVTNYLGSEPLWFVNNDKVDGSVIWLSSPDRGLHLLLQEWSKIRKAVPNATLKIFYHINDPGNAPTESANRIRYIRQAIPLLKELGAEYVGSVSRNQIVEELSKATVMVAPLSTVAPTEGFSVSTMEACMAGCLPIVGDIDCLGSIYNKVACMIASPVEDHLDDLANCVIKGLTDATWRSKIVKKCQEFAKNYTWDANVDRLVNIITEHPKYKNNKTIIATTSIIKTNSDKPDISIMMPTMRPGGLDVVFKSLSEQTFKNFELVIVDGIYQYRKDLIKEKAKEYNFPIKHVEPIKNTFPHSCLSHSTNTGFVNCSSDLVLMITDYTYLPPDCVEKHIKFHIDYPAENMGYMCPHQYRSLPELHQDFFPYQNSDIDKYVEDLKNGKLNNVMWSIFKNNFNQNPKILPLDSMGDADNKLFRSHGLGDPLAFNAKNESMKLEAALKVNGWDEELDGTVPYQDNVFSDLLEKKLDFKWIVDKNNKIYIINPRFVTPHSKRTRTSESNFDIWNKKRANNFSDPINNWSLSKCHQIFMSRQINKEVKLTMNKLNLGSGISGYNALYNIAPDHNNWKNIDICPDYNPTECYDITQGIQEKDSSIEEIWMGDFFEHLMRAQANFVIKECFRVLQSGGKIRISVPDMEKAMPLWLSSDTDQEYTDLIWGQQGEWNNKNHIADSHMNGYTESRLKKLLSSVGFNQINRVSIREVWYELALVAFKP